MNLEFLNEPNKQLVQFVNITPPHPRYQIHPGIISQEIPPVRCYILRKVFNSLFLAMHFESSLTTACFTIPKHRNSQIMLILL